MRVHLCLQPRICRFGQNHVYAPYMTVYLVVSLPKTPYIHHIYRVLANPTYMYTVYARMYGTSPAKNTVHTLYIRVYV
jgi:hypothetical protein